MSSGYAQGQRIIGHEQNGTDSRFLTSRHDALGPEEWQLPEPPRDIGNAALDSLVGGADPVATKMTPATIWNAGQVAVGQTPVKLADMDTGRTALRIRNTDATQAVVWLANNTAVNTGGTGSISLPINTTYSMAHAGEVWAVTAVGTVMVNVEVERSN